MKCSKYSARVGFAVLLIAFVMAMAGSAWADEASVAGAVTTFGHGLSAVSGTGTVTISGNSASMTASETLNLGDISGVTIDWQATLTVNGGGNPNTDVDTRIIKFSGNGTFKMTAGAINITNANGSIWAISATSGSPTVTIAGGAITSDGNNYHTSGIEISSEAGSNVHGTLNITGGTLNIPKKGVVAQTENVGTINGNVINGVISKKDANGIIANIYGTYEIGASDTMDIKSEITLINIGTLNIYGTLTNKFKLINSATGVINVWSGNTLDNQADLKNDGIINIKSTGRMRNTGTIDNNSGTINNTEGGVLQSAQTKEQMGGAINGDVQPISGDGSGSGGGCDAGFAFGVFGLLFAGLAAFKHRKP